MSISKKITLVFYLLIGGLILINLTRQISTALNMGSRLDLAVEEVASLQEENKKLKNRLSEVQKYDYIEEIARNELNLAKPNETVIIIPAEDISKILALERSTFEPKLPNWKGWLRLFFN